MNTDVNMPHLSPVTAVLPAGAGFWHRLDRAAGLVVCIIVFVGGVVVPIGAFVYGLVN